jgi:hypothetical protein
MTAVQNKDEQAQQYALHWMIWITKPWMIQQWAESTLSNGKPLVQILHDNTHPIHLEWTEDQQAHMETLVEWYTLCGASRECSIH